MDSNNEMNRLYHELYRFFDQNCNVLIKSVMSNADGCSYELYKVYDIFSRHGFEVYRNGDRIRRFYQFPDAINFINGFTNPNDKLTYEQYLDTSAVSQQWKFFSLKKANGDCVTGYIFAVYNSITFNVYDGDYECMHTDHHVFLNDLYTRTN